MKAVKKKIAINAWILKNKEYDGIAYYTINCLPLLCEELKEYKVFLLVDWKFNLRIFEKLENVRIIRLFPPYRHPLLYLFFLEIIFPIYGFLNRIDILLGMDGMISLSAGCKQIPIIHDLNFLHYPNSLPFRNRLYYNVLFKHYANKAARIITISAFTKNDIVKNYLIDPNKIDIVYAFSNSGYKEISTDLKNEIKRTYSQGEDYFAVLGSIHPRKNIDTTLKAFKLFLSLTDKKYKLVIIGKFLWNNQKLLSLLSELSIKDSVIFAGRLSDEETNLVLGSAKALVFVSLFEGFGMPLLEAFSTRTPVICSNTTSLDEIAGDAALKVNPIDTGEIAYTMKLISEDSDLTNQLIRNGDKRLRDFSWEKTASLIYESINKIIT